VHSKLLIEALRRQHDGAAPHHQTS
jgi:hypothetical protein